jgi:hypothetical protein
MPGCALAADGIVNRTFIVAHLLAGRIDLAESATLEAIDACDPDIESDEELFRHGVAAALRNRERRNASSLCRDHVTHSYCPLSCGQFWN